ncbi:MAG TPA: hypothetical protein PK020_18410 [Ilumatobacteraceae bacterium]|nr:hypothetical protein [Ilumatobacteraceae bacterium]
MDQSELNQMKAELQRMQARIEELEAPGAQQPMNRRNMLRGIGVAAVGAAAGGLAFARPAAATDGGSIVIGDSSQTGTSPTVLVPATGWSSTPLTGAFTVSNDASFTNINAALSCIAAYADSSKPSGHTIGLFAASKSGVGAKLDGPVPLKLTDSSLAGAPLQTTGTQGRFQVDNGDLWFCVNSAGSARWRKITGKGVAGAFHLLTPGRVYDSRAGNGGAGPLATGQNRTISVANRIATSGGAVVENNFVPAGATAVTLNITAVGTVADGGYMAVNPGGNTTVSASSINWANGQTIANGIVCSLNGTRQLTIITGGTGASADFLIDITGYYM